MISEAGGEETDVQLEVVAAMRRNQDGEPIPKERGDIRVDPMRILNILNGNPDPPMLKATEDKRSQKTVTKNVRWWFTGAKALYAIRPKH